MKKRDLRDDERALWDEVTRDVRRPARKRKIAKAGAPSPPRADGTTASPKSPKPASIPKPSTSKVPTISTGIPGLDGATAERLRRGRIEPDATLDLHGLTQVKAHTRLVSFVRRRHADGDRCVLIVTGKGSPLREDIDASTRGFVMPERSKAGVLRALLPAWLEHAELRPFIVGIQTAHQRHGGAGAFYVYLRRKTAR